MGEMIICPYGLGRWYKRIGGKPLKEIFQILQHFFAVIGSNYNKEFCCHVLFQIIFDRVGVKEWNTRTEAS